MLKQISISRRILLIVIFTFILLPMTKEISYSQTSMTNVPREAEKHYQKGSEQYFAENYIGAFKEYSEAIKSCNYYFWAYLSRGYTLMKLGRFREAEDDFTNALKLDPKSVDACICRGLIRKEIKDYEGAIQDFSRAIEIKPSFPDSYNNRGILKSFLKDYEGAIQDFNKAIEFDERFGEAYFNRGAAKFNINKATDACEDWQIAYDLGVKQSEQMITVYCQ